MVYPQDNYHDLAQLLLQIVFAIAVRIINPITNISAEVIHEVHVNELIATFEINYFESDYLLRT